jgi:hypothetical protein
MFPHIDGHVSISIPLASSQYAVPVQAVFSFSDANNRWEFGDLSDESKGIWV